jgi:hypothetical protein
MKNFQMREESSRFTDFIQKTRPEFYVAKILNQKLGEKQSVITTIYEKL